MLANIHCLGFVGELDCRPLRAEFLGYMKLKLPFVLASCVSHNLEAKLEFTDVETETPA